MQVGGRALALIPRPALCWQRLKLGRDSCAEFATSFALLAVALSVSILPNIFVFAL